MPKRENRKWVKIEKWEKSKNQPAERSGDHVTEGVLCLLSRQGQKRGKKLEVQVFLARLLASLALAGLPRFCLVIEASGLTIGLAIGGAESIGGEVAVGFSGWSRWKVLMSLRRCSIAEARSQVFSSSG